MNKTINWPEFLSVIRKSNSMIFANGFHASSEISKNEKSMEVSIREYEGECVLGLFNFHTEDNGEIKVKDGNFHLVSDKNREFTFVIYKIDN